MGLEPAIWSTRETSFSIAGFLLALLCAAATPSAAAEPIDFMPVASVEPQIVAAALPPDYLDSPALVQIQYAQVNVTLLASVLFDFDDEVVTLRLFENLELALVSASAIVREEVGHRVWSGFVQAIVYGSATLVLGPDSSLTGVIYLDERSFEIVPLGAEGLVAIIEWDGSNLPESAPPVYGSAGVDWQQDPAANASDWEVLEEKPVVTIDVLSLYPREYLRNWCLDPVRMKAHELGLEAHAQRVLDYRWQSDVAFDFTVVCLDETPPTGGTFSPADSTPTYHSLTWLRSSPGPFSPNPIEKLRDLYHADLVTLGVQTSDLCATDVTGQDPPKCVCGIGTYNDYREGFGLDPDAAFSVVGFSCTFPGYTLMHELGHNLGMHHDRQAEANGSITAGENAAILFSPACNFGRIVDVVPPPEAPADFPTQFRTVMAYRDFCEGSCPRIGTYSTALPVNAEVLFDNELFLVEDFVPGTSCLASPSVGFAGELLGNLYNRADNWRHLRNLTAPLVAGFR